jgi:acyl-CoA thioesterase FadM
MQDAYYLVAFGDGLDAFFRFIGDDEAYRASGLTFFTAETHLNYYREMKAGEPFTIETQLVGMDEKRMHLFHRMLHGKTGELVATNEIMQLHVDQKSGKVAPMRADIFEALSAVWAEHKKLKAPAELGRVMNVPKKDKKKTAAKKPAKKKAKR